LVIGKLVNCIYSMSLRILWLVLIAAVIILGITVYFAYFFEIEIKDAELLTRGDLGSPSDTFPVPDNIIPPSPDYEPGDDNKPDDPGDGQPTERAPKMKIVSYRGFITKVGSSSIEFEPRVEGGSEKLVTAFVDVNTKITQIFLSAEVVEESIELTDLKVGDEVSVSGLAQDYFEPIPHTIQIERFYLGKK